jgi:hypothetical protein
VNMIADGWGRFEKLVLDSNAPPIQRQEMRRAFYAGVHLALMIARDLIGDPEVSEEVGIAALNSMHDEIQAFNRAIQEGRA